MSCPSALPDPLPIRKPRTPRWLVIILAVALTHILFFQWAGGHIGLPTISQAKENIITTALLTPKNIPTPPAAEPVTRQPRRSPPRPRPQPTPEPMPAREPVAEDAPTPSLAGMEAPGTSVETPTDIASPTPPAASQEQAADYKIDPPPSAELKYDVQALNQGQTLHGNGKIDWQTAGNSYRINGEAGVLFLTLLNFRSEGMIDEFGVSPVIYSEKRFRRSETNTHFHRERNTISFSASTLSYPRKGGEQDRASLVWQLAGMGRGGKDRFVPGAEIEVIVAGVRDAEPWRIRVIGEEEIELGVGRLRTWHMLRVPRQGSYDQKLDIWLAPQREWYPVRLRFTEVNGDYLDMSLSKLTSAN